MRREVIAAIIGILIVASLGLGYLATGDTRTGASSTSVFTYQTVTTTTSIATTNTLFENSTISWSYVSTSTSAFNATWVPGEPIPAAMVETAAISVGQISGPLAVDPSAGRVYALEGDSLIVVDTSSQLVVANVTLPAASENAIALDPATHMVYVLVKGGVAEVDGSTDTIVRTIPADFGYGSLAYDSVTRVLYGPSGGATGPRGGPVSVLAVDPRTGSMVANISVGFAVSDISVDPTTNTVFLAGCYDAGLACNSTAALVDGTSETVVKTIQLGSPYYETSAMNPSTGTFYISGESELAALNGTSGRVAFSVNPQSCGPFFAMAVDTSSNMVLMVPQDTNYLAVYDGTSGRLVNMYWFPTPPGPLAFDSGNGELYVGTNSGQLLALHMLTATGNVNSTLIGSSQNCLPV